MNVSSLIEKIKLYHPGYSSPPTISGCSTSSWSGTKVQNIFSYLTHAQPDLIFATQSELSLFQTGLTRAECTLETSQQILSEEEINLQFVNHLWEIAHFTPANSRSAIKASQLINLESSSKIWKCLTNHTKYHLLSRLQETHFQLL